MPNAAELFRNLGSCRKRSRQKNVADVNSSNATRCTNEETQSESTAHTNTGRVAKSTTAWRASCFGRKDTDDEYDDLVGEQERTVCKQHRGSELWSYSGNEEWSDEENDELWSELENYDDYDSPYDLLTRTDETWEIESGKCPTQAVERDFKPTEELADLKLECGKQDSAKGGSRNAVARNSDLSC